MSLWKCLVCKVQVPAKPLDWSLISRCDAVKFVFLWNRNERHESTWVNRTEPTNVYNAPEVSRLKLSLLTYTNSLSKQVNIQKILARLIKSLKPEWMEKCFALQFFRLFFLSSATSAGNTFNSKQLSRTPHRNTENKCVLTFCAFVAGVFLFLAFACLLPRNIAL